MDCTVKHFLSEGESSHNVLNGNQHLGLVPKGSVLSSGTMICFTEV